jgi:hypothetical protein
MGKRASEDENEGAWGSRRCREVRDLDDDVTDRAGGWTSKNRMDRLFIAKSYI